MAWPTCLTLKTGKKVLSDSGFLPTLPYIDFQFYEDCTLRKENKSRHNMHVEVAMKILVLVHYNVCGQCLSACPGERGCSCPLEIKKGVNMKAL